MPSPKQPWTDQRVEEIVGNLLRGGVIVAAIVVLAGGFVYLVRYGGPRPIIAYSTASPRICGVFQES